LNALEFVFCAGGWAEAERDGRGNKLTALSRGSGCCCRTHCFGWGRRLVARWVALAWVVGGRPWVCAGELRGDLLPGWGAAATIETFNGGGLLDGLPPIGGAGDQCSPIGVFGDVPGVLDTGLPGRGGGHRGWALPGGRVGCVVFAAAWWPGLRCREWCCGAGGFVPPR
jgi:hypothetical protein